MMYMCYTIIASMYDSCAQREYGRCVAINLRVVLLWRRDGAAF